MIRLLSLLTLALLLPFAAASTAQEATADLEAALADPPATGLLVTQVFDGSQAAEIGLRPGDVVVSYAGTPTPDLPTLSARKDEVMAEESVEMIAVRGRRKLSFRVMPGQIGFQAIAVVKGEPPPALPEETVRELDVASIGEEPVERWYDFYLQGEKQGYETWTLAKSGGRIFLSSEVGFDGGEGFGLNHMKVSLALTAQGRPQLIFCRFENALNGWTALTTIRGRRGGARFLDYRWWFGEDRGENEPVRARADLLPTYFVQSIAYLMPREEGACYHFFPLQEGFGQAGLKSAVVCRGQEEVEHGGEAVPAWRYEWVDFAGAVSWTYWITDLDELIRVNWGGAVRVLTTKSKALDGVRRELLPAE